MILLLMTDGVFKGFNVKQEEFVMAACCSMLVAFLETQELDETTKTRQIYSQCLM
ncbi:MAG: hypothetical protein QOC99_1029 [Acidobacteriota bacterium]|nr:hypothetical protein [Acidobacteriota bacterium]MDT7778517.1 hypothetical protein [Acidobacteriota bacterium]